MKLHDHFKWSDGFYICKSNLNSSFYQYFGDADHLGAALVTKMSSLCNQKWCEREENHTPSWSSSLSKWLYDNFAHCSWNLHWTEKLDLPVFMDRLQSSVIACVLQLPANNSNIQHINKVSYILFFKSSEFLLLEITELFSAYVFWCGVFKISHSLSK